MSLDPSTLAIASLATSAVGTVVTTIGQVQQGKAQQAAFEYQAGIARNNEIIAQRAAEDARKRGELEANLQRERGRLLRGQQRAALAGAGVLVDTGSAGRLIEDTAAFSELDALTIQSNAEREALGFETQAMNFQGEGAIASASAKSARTQSLFKAGGSLLTGFGSVAEKWSTFKKLGVL